MMWEKIRMRGAELSLWAERELAGKSGREKRRAVVLKMCETIKWPWVPDFIESLFEPVLYGWIVDSVCNVLNILGDGDFSQMELTQEQIYKVVSLVDVKRDGDGVVPDVIYESSGMSLDDRLDALCEKYAKNAKK